MQCVHVTEALRLVDRCSLVAGQDVWTAFDPLRHHVLQWVLFKGGVHPMVILAILAELHDLDKV